MAQESAISDANIFPYMLSVTTRDAGHDEPEDVQLMDELTYRTIMTWHTIVGYLEQGVYKYTKGSVEQEYANKINEDMTAKADTDGPPFEPFEFKEVFGKSRVEVWATFRGEKNPFHLCSDDNPQRAINVWLGHNRGVKRAIEKLALNTPQSHQDAPPQGATAPQQPNTQERPATTRASNPVQDNGNVVIASRAPNPNEKTYAEGQLVEFKINKIVLGTHPTSGSVIYSLWGDLGKKYALKTVYVMASNGTEKSYDYQTAAPVLESLALSIPGKMQSEGNWKMVCKATNSGEKQYLNIQCLTAI